MSMADNESERTWNLVVQTPEDANGRRQRFFSRFLHGKTNLQVIISPNDWERLKRCCGTSPVPPPPILIDPDDLIRQISILEKLLHEQKRIANEERTQIGKAKAETITEIARLEYELEKVTQINDIMKMGVMVTPALAIDGDVKVTGKVPSTEDIKPMLS